MSYEARLIIKDGFQLDGALRVNTLKISLAGDKFIVWVSNGDNKYGRFALTMDAAKQLKDFLQGNIK